MSVTDDRKSTVLNMLSRQDIKFLGMPGHRWWLSKSANSPIFEIIEDSSDQ